MQLVSCSNLGRHLPAQIVSEHTVVAAWLFDEAAIVRLMPIHNAQVPMQKGLTLVF